MMVGNILKIFTLLVIFVPLSVPAQENSCPELLKNESDLDRVYDLSNLVFIARIRPRNSINPQIFNYQRFDPVIKGDLPEQGFVTFADSCYPKAEDSIYLFMLDSLDEKVEGYNAVFFSLPDGGPGFTWIAEWIEAKINESVGDDAENN